MKIKMSSSFKDSSTKLNNDEFPVWLQNFLRKDIGKDELLTLYNQCDYYEKVSYSSTFRFF